jgi:hypothetical protein
LLLDPDADGVGAGGVLPVTDPAPIESPPVTDDAGFRPDEQALVPEQTATQAVGEGQAAQQSSEQWQSIREAASAYGYDLSQYQDDRAALAHLIQSAQAARQANVYAQLGQQLAPHAQQIQTYLQQQQQPAQQAPNPWEPPEFDERWLGLVDRDPATGLFVGKTGVPHEIVAKVNSFAQWQQKWSTQGPQMVEQMVDRRVGDVVARAVQEQLARYQRSQAVDQIVAQNSAWIYQRDQQGNVVRDHQGNPLPTPQGVRYAQHVRSLQQHGVMDPRAQDQLARQLVAGEYALAAGQQGQAAAPPAQQQNALVSGRQQVNPLQTRPQPARAATPGVTEASTEGKSLSELLREELDKAGITDVDFEPQ